MSTQVRRALAVAGVVIVCVLLLRPVGGEPRPNGGFDLRAEGDARWLRGNIHTHSLWSDGDDFPDMIVNWYREHGYQFLCLTDHNVMMAGERWIDVENKPQWKKAAEKLRAQFDGDWVAERVVDGRSQIRLKTFEELQARFDDPGVFLLLQGEEITDRFRNRPIHLNATNVERLITPRGGESVLETLQNNVDAVLAERERTKRSILVHVNHPNYGGAISAEDLSRVRGENFFEVYNGHPGVANDGDAEHASTERMWDIILALRLGDLGLPVMYGLATDDAHNYHNIPSRGSEPGRGWVVVLSRALDGESLVTALEQGRFYSSTGVALERVRFADRELLVEVKPEDGVQYTIEFIGTRAGFDRTSEAVKNAAGEELPVTRRYSSEVGAVLATREGVRGSYRLAGDELYVRARVTSTRKHPNPSRDGEFERAWTQPVVPGGERGVRGGP